jgi:Peptidase A4 family
MKHAGLRTLVVALPTGAMASVLSLGALGSSVGAAAAPVITHAARIGVGGAAPDQHGSVRDTWSASNWSGYAETGTFTGVTSTWTVPAVTATSSSTYSSTWIGVDGFNDDDLIQTGTEQDYYSGSAHYDAWWEILPAAETEISPSAYPVTPGDRMSASIYETSSTTGGRFRRGSEHVWSITISDTSRGWKFTTDQGYSGPGSSAEWVMEAPEVNGAIASLAHYSFSPPANTGDFDSAGYLTGIVSSGSPTYTTAGLNYQNDGGVMIQNGAQVSTPSNPDGAKTAFNAAYGSTQPAAPVG